MSRLVVHHCVRQNKQTYRRLAHPLFAASTSNVILSLPTDIIQLGDAGRQRERESALVIATSIRVYETRSIYTARTPNTHIGPETCWTGRHSYVVGARS